MLFFNFSSCFYFCSLVFAGWVWLWVANFPSVREILSR